MKGRAFVFGDEINTDVIAPSEYRHEHRVEHLMEPIRPDFVDEIQGGEIIVAGEHFGSGSSREIAPTIIQENGIAAVVAESFARIYYRNSVNIGLPAITCPNITDIVTEGDEIEIDMDEGIITNVTTGETAACELLPEALQGLFDAGGIFEYYHSVGELKDA